MNSPPFRDSRSFSSAIFRSCHFCFQWTIFLKDLFFLLSGVPHPSSCKFSQMSPSPRYSPPAPLLRSPYFLFVIARYFFLSSVALKDFLNRSSPFRPSILTPHLPLLKNSFLLPSLVGSSPLTFRFLQTSCPLFSVGGPLADPFPFRLPEFSFLSFLFRLLKFLSLPLNKELFVGP